MYNIDPGLCYQTRYYGQPARGYDKGFVIAQLIGYERAPKGPDVRVTGYGLPGDPANWEINVDGHIFIYNGIGEIFDNRGRRVGQMFCYSSNDCEKHGVK